jgi:hypothetical protein
MATLVMVLVASDSAISDLDFDRSRSTAISIGRGSARMDTGIDRMCIGATIIGPMPSAPITTDPTIIVAALVDAGKD